MNISFYHDNEQYSWSLIRTRYFVKEHQWRGLFPALFIKKEGFLLIQKTVNRLRKNNGYISIETVIVAGLVIGLGAIAIASFQTSANHISQTSIGQINGVENSFSNLSL